MHAGRALQRGRPLRHRPGRQPGEDDPLLDHRRPGRFAAAGDENALLERLRGPAEDQAREQQLQRSDGRHDLLRLRGARSRRRRRQRDHGSREVRQVPAQSRPEAVGRPARRDLLLRALGRPRVHQRLRPLRERLPGGRRQRGNQRRDALQAWRPRLPRPTTRSPTRARTGSTARFRWGKNLAGVLPRRALLPQRQSRLRRRLRQPARQWPARPRARPRRRPAAPLFAAIVPSLANPVTAGLPRNDQRPEPDDARPAPAAKSSRRRSRARPRPSRWS